MSYYKFRQTGVEIQDIFDDVQKIKQDVSHTATFSDGSLGAWIINLANNTNTHRPIQMNGSEILGNNVTPLNFAAGTNVTLTNDGGTLTISASGSSEGEQDEYTPSSGTKTINGNLTIDGNYDIKLIPHLSNNESCIGYHGYSFKEGSIKNLYVNEISNLDNAPIKFDSFCEGNHSYYQLPNDLDTTSSSRHTLATEEWVNDQILEKPYNIDLYNSSNVNRALKFLRIKHTSGISQWEKASLSIKVKSTFPSVEETILIDCYYYPGDSGSMQFAVNGLRNHIYKRYNSGQSFIGDIFAVLTDINTLDFYMMLPTHIGISMQSYTLSEYTKDTLLTITQYDTETTNLYVYGTKILPSNSYEYPAITLNGEYNFNPSFYAPTTSGISGQFLTSDNNGIPTWGIITSTLFSGSSDSVSRDTLINTYRFFIINGYKANTSTPNQISFVLSSGNAVTSSNFSIRLVANEWEYTLRLSDDGTRIYFYTTTDYGSNTKFIVTSIVGVM